MTSFCLQKKLSETPCSHYSAIYVPKVNHFPMVTQTAFKIDMLAYMRVDFATASSIPHNTFLDQGVYFCIHQSIQKYNMVVDSRPEESKLRVSISLLE